MKYPGEWKNSGMTGYKMCKKRLNNICVDNFVEIVVFLYKIQKNEYHIIVDI